VNYCVKILQIMRNSEASKHLSFRTNTKFSMQFLEQNECTVVSVTDCTLRKIVSHWRWWWPQNVHCAIVDNLDSQHHVVNTKQASKQKIPNVVYLVGNVMYSCQNLLRDVYICNNELNIKICCWKKDELCEACCIMRDSPNYA